MRKWNVKEIDITWHEMYKYRADWKRVQLYFEQSSEVGDGNDQDHQIYSCNPKNTDRLMRRLSERSQYLR